MYIFVSIMSSGTCLIHKDCFLNGIFSAVSYWDTREEKPKIILINAQNHFVV